jgi:hypothetical protein
MNALSGVVKIPGASSPGQLSSVWGYLIFLDYQYRKLLHVTYLAPRLLENLCTFVLFYGLLINTTAGILGSFYITFVNDDVHVYEQVWWNMKFVLVVACNTN